MFWERIAVFKGVKLFAAKKHVGLAKFRSGCRRTSCTGIPK